MYLHILIFIIFRNRVQQSMNQSPISYPLYATKNDLVESTHKAIHRANPWLSEITHFI